MDLFRSLPKSYPSVPNARAEVMERLRHAARTPERAWCCFLIQERVEAAWALHREGEIRCVLQDHNGRAITVCTLPPPKPPRPSPWKEPA